VGLVAGDSISSGLDTGGDIKKQKAGEVMETTVSDGPHMRKAERRLFGAVQCSEKTFRALANHESTHARMGRSQIAPSSDQHRLRGTQKPSESS